MSKKARSALAQSAITRIKSCCGAKQRRCGMLCVGASPRNEATAARNDNVCAACTGDAAERHGDIVNVFCGESHWRLLGVRRWRVARRGRWDINILGIGDGASRRCLLAVLLRTRRRHVRALRIRHAEQRGRRGVHKRRGVSLRRAAPYRAAFSRTWHHRSHVLYHARIMTLASTGAPAGRGWRHQHMALLYHKHAEKSCACRRRRCLRPARYHSVPQNSKTARINITRCAAARSKTASRRS